MSDHRPPPPPPPPPPPGTPPPSFGPPTGPPAGEVPPDLKRVGGIGSAIGLITAVVGVAAVLSGFTQSAAREDAQRFLDGVITEEQFLEAYAAASSTSAISSLGQIAIAVLTFVLLARMARNLRTLGRRTTWGPRWAVAGWLLPPGVLYLIPWLMFREIWKASDPSATGDDWRHGGVPVSFWVWWVAFGLAPIALATMVGVSAVNAGLMATDTRAIATVLAEQYWITLSSSAGTAVAAVAYIVMVRALVARHRIVTRESLDSRR